MPVEYIGVKFRKGREVDCVGCSRLRNGDTYEVRGLSGLKAVDTRIFVWI